MDLPRAIKFLELTEISQPEDIQKAFRLLAHLWHPDKNPDPHAAEHFRSLIVAYEYCLEHLDDVFTYFGKIRMPASTASHGGPQVANQEDIFDDIFGFSSTGRILGAHEPQIISLTVKEFCQGVIKTGRYVAYEACSDCKSVGATQGTPARICRHCFGQGQIISTLHDQRKRIDCPRCYGRGRDVQTPCTSCAGFGRLRTNHRQRVNFPRGMRPYDLYALECQDLQTRRPAQIFVEPRVLPDRIFKIENYDLLCEYHLDLLRHKRQKRVRLKTPLGDVLLTLNVGGKSGDVLTLSGQGLYKDSSGSARGDLRILLRHKRDSLFKRLFGGRS